MTEFITPNDCHDTRRCINYAGKYYSEKFENELFHSLGMCHDVEWSVVIDNENGCGVYSWHFFEGHARHNALIVGGTAVPVDRKDGYLLTPEKAKQAVRRFMNDL